MKWRAPESSSEWRRLVLFVYVKTVKEVMRKEQFIAIST